MLTLNVHFLTGRYAATAYNDRSVAEWPPHPARLYSAFVDALYDGDTVDAEEAAALDALATLPAPVVVASEANARRVMTTFVPVNDAAVTDAATLTKRERKLREARAEVAALPADASPEVRGKAEKRLKAARADLAAYSAKEAAAGKTPKDNPGPRVLPWGRVKQPRTFPVVVPHVPRIAFVYPDADVDVRALQRIAGRVVRLGHSSSMVHVHVDTQGPPPDPALHRWQPDVDGDQVLRVPMPGQRGALVKEYQRHGGDLPGRVMPARHARYLRAIPARPLGTTRRSHGRWLVYDLTEKPFPPAHAAVALADALRSALLSHVSEEAPELSGLEGGRPIARPHLAVVPLPFVGHRHADGAIRGVALSLPPGTDAAAEQALLRALGRWEAATGDPTTRAVTFHVAGRTVRATRVVDEDHTLLTLQRWRWATPSRRWCTVTPIALDGECSPLNHPDPSTRRRAHRTAAKLVRRAVLRAVIPPDGASLEASDIGVSLVFDAPVAGAAHLGAVPPFQRPGHPRPRRLVHAVIELPFQIRGPLLLGSGRHFGLGLCTPTRDGDA